MIINDKLFALEDQCKYLSKCIKESGTMKEYLKAKTQMEQSTEVKALLADFSKKKEQYEKVAPYQDYAPEFRERKLVVRQAKRKLDLNEQVAKFRLAENQLQQILDEIGQQLAETVSLTIKIDAGNPFFENRKHSGCGGNCHG
ncbi:transcriptional regulator [Enterococcus villorum]|uniref:Transcriptional regulator n=1 Tax=Enterococcus villorum TaxID=112904 RepID=A0A1V8YFB8_9ENTE|nr:YlbF family regulator [Enterococcus villorum]OQO71282.1 transcriptional regulator [Enterococcus villorum]OQO73533.1 transcriptional regulator [Enterococcus villorum]